jgi:hypothetical protein
MIQIMLALASGSSSVSRFSHNVAMIDSYCNNERELKFRQKG